MENYYKNPRIWEDEDRQRLRESLIELGDLSGITHDLNSDELITGNFRSDIISINDCKIVLTNKYKKPDPQGTVAWGYVVWEGKRLNYRQVRWTKEQCERANILANAAGGKWDYEYIIRNWDLPTVESLGLDLPEWVSTAKDDIDFISNIIDENKKEEDPKEKPKPASKLGKEYSIFELVMLYENKLKFIEVLNEIKEKNQYLKLEDSIIHLIDNYHEKQWMR